MFRVVQEDQLRLPSQVPSRLFDGLAQPCGIQGMFRPIRRREIADLRGDRELRQQVAGCPRQYLMRMEAEVAGAGVERRDTEVKRPGQETAFVTRPV